MNCKPGDLAVIVRETRFGEPLLGKLCTVLRRAPSVDFTLPDGHWHQGCPSSVWWVVEFPNNINAPMSKHLSDVTRSTRFACAPDSALRPIRDNDGEDETLTWAPKHEGVTA